MDTLLEELLTGVKEGSSDDNDGGGSISGFNILSLGDLDEHLGGRVDDLHLLEDGGSIVSDEDLSFGVLNLSGKKTGLTILSIPLGPRDVLTTSETALAAMMLFIRVSCSFSDLDSC